MISVWDAESQDHVPAFEVREADVTKLTGSYGDIAVIKIVGKLAPLSEEYTGKIRDKSGNLIDFEDVAAHLFRSAFSEEPTRDKSGSFTWRINPKRQSFRTRTTKGGKQDGDEAG